MSTQYDATSDAEAQNPSAAVAMGEKIIERESEIRRLLERLSQQALVGDRTELRGKLRRLASRDASLLRGLTFTLQSHDQYFTDLESADFEDLDTLRELQSEFESLSEEFFLVTFEEITGGHNVMPEVKSHVTGAKDGEGALLTSTIHSGDMELATFRLPATHTLKLAEKLLDHATQFLDDVGEDALVASNQENLALVVEELAEHVERLEAQSAVWTGTDAGEEREVEDPGYYFN